MAMPEGLELEAISVSEGEPATEILRGAKDLNLKLATPEGLEPPTLSSED